MSSTFSSRTGTPAHISKSFLDIPTISVCARLAVLERPIAHPVKEIKQTSTIAEPLIAFPLLYCECLIGTGKTSSDLAVAQPPRLAGKSMRGDMVVSLLRYETTLPVRQAIGVYTSKHRMPGAILGATTGRGVM
jgi:hypothetical protein